MKAGTQLTIKFKKLHRAMGYPPQYCVTGLLEELWHTTARETMLGDIGRLSNDDIAASVGWEGDADELIAMLVECGWLDESDDHRLVVHEWHEHAPNFVKGNVNKRGAEWATVAKQPPSSTSDPAKQPPSSTSDPAKQPPSSTSDPAKQPPSSTSDPPSSTSDPATKPSLAKPSLTNPSHTNSPEVPSALTDWCFPVNANEGVDWQLPEDLFRTLVDSYPAVDVPAQLKAARAWLITNARRRKTPRGMPAFLNSWMERNQNRAPPSGTPPNGNNRAQRQIEAMERHRQQQQLEADDDPD